MKVLLAAVAMLLAGWGSFCAQAQEAPPEEEWRVWLEPKFMRPPVNGPIAGAERTVIAAGVKGEGDPAYLLQPQFDALKLPWTQFLAKARVHCDADLEAVKVEFTRDKKKVIQFAAVTAPEPIVASAVLSPKFLDRFRETIGDKLLVVVPSRYRAYVFPRLASSYEQYSPMIFEAYRSSAYPVSVEVFEVSAEGWKAIGIYEE